MNKLSWNTTQIFRLRGSHQQVEQRGNTAKPLRTLQQCYRLLMEGHFNIFKWGGLWGGGGGGGKNDVYVCVWRGIMPTYLLSACTPKTNWKKISTKFGIVSLNQSLLKTRKIQRKIDRFSQQTIIVHKLPCDVKQPALSLRCASLKYETFFR